MIMLNILDPRIHFRREVEQLTHLPVISTIPKITVDVGEFKLKHFRLLKNNKSIKDSFFQVIAKIGHRGTEQDQGKVIAMTTPASGEGATFSALALAFNLAKNKSTKVCLIDANFNSPMISTLFDTNEQQGLIEGLTSLQSLTNYQSNVSFNFSVIGAGSTASKNQLGFYTDTAKKQIDELRSLFDYIIIDTGSALNDNEVMVFGSFAEETLMVASSGITRKGMLQAAISKLQSNGNAVTGIIFNQTKEIIPAFIYRMF
jgi:tyrosine-protein kinase Etk/Wzc